MQRKGSDSAVDRPAGRDRITLMEFRLTGSEHDDISGHAVDRPAMCIRLIRRESVTETPNNVKEATYTHKSG